MVFASSRRRSLSAASLTGIENSQWVTTSAVAIAELAGDRVVGADGHEGVEDVVGDVPGHLLPALRARQQLQLVGQVAQPVMVEGGAVLRRRGVEGDAGAHVDGSWVASSSSVAAVATSGFMQTWNSASERPALAAPARTAGSITCSM